MKYPKTADGLTEPQSPVLHTKQRATLKRLSSSQSEQEIQQFKARPIPQTIFEPFVPQKVEVPLTEPTPFSLTTDQRGNQHKTAFQQKVEEMRKTEEKLRHFKAAPMPVLDEPHIPSKPRDIPLTEPTGFALRTEQRGTLHQQQFSVKVDEELVRDYEQRNFKVFI